ncbi:MAG: hypothetical protein WC708_05550 [Lentisphaeria bacterium]
MNQKETNLAEWRNRDNWSGGFYFSKKDSRTWVPKSVPCMGWTLNLGRPAGARWLMGILIGEPVLLVVVLLLAGVR